MRSTERGIRFAVWNAHSVINKGADIEYLLHDRELDILRITETWLDEDVAFEFFGYLTYRCDCSGGGGGGSVILGHTGNLDLIFLSSSRIGVASACVTDDTSGSDHFLFLGDLGVSTPIH